MTFWKREEYDKDSCIVCGHTEESNPIKEFHSELIGKTTENKLMRYHSKPPICMHCSEIQTLQIFQETVNQINISKIENFQEEFA